jgi:hypothetical protein
MHIPVFTRLSAMCVAGAALSASANASAGTHYYAQHVAQVSGSADDGAFTNIWTNVLHSTCTIFTQNFVNHEMWYAFGTGTYWVEVGFKDGLDGSGSCHTDVLFWADNRNGGGYSEHYPGNGWSFGGWYPLQISSAGSCTWSVLFNGTNIGTSTANCPGSGRLLQAGIESTSQTTGSAQGWLGNWWEESGSGNWQQAWTNDFICQSYGNLDSCTSGNPQIEWASGIGTEEVLNEGF